MAKSYHEIPIFPRKLLLLIQLALLLLDRIRGIVPYEAITFDAEYGEIRDFLAALDGRKELFVGQIPESHGFWPKDVVTDTTSRSSRGRPRKHPLVADRRDKLFSAVSGNVIITHDGN